MSQIPQTIHYPQPSYPKAWYSRNTSVKNSYSSASYLFTEPLDDNLKDCSSLKRFKNLMKNHLISEQ